MKKTFLSTLVYGSLFSTGLTPALSANPQDMINEELQNTVALQQKQISEIETKNQQLLSILEQQKNQYVKDSAEKSEQIATLGEALDEAKVQIDSNRESQSVLKTDIEESKKILNQDIDNLTSDTSSKISDLDKKVFNWTWVGLLSLLALLGLLTSVYWYLRKQHSQKSDSLVNKVQAALESVKKAEENIVESDTQLVIQLSEVLTQIKLQQDDLTQAQALAATSSENVVASSDEDHSLAIKLADEIHRMRRRISALPEDTKGLKSLSKSLERLEDELKHKGYEIIDYTGMNYIEGMTLKARFIPNDDLDDGQSIITRVIYPQVNFKEKLIQKADVEVSVG